MSKFKLGERSQSRLTGVHPELVMCVREAINRTEQDFGVYEGLRTLERQKKLVASGASRTLRSRHIPDRSGVGHAVDLVPFIDGEFRWEWGPIYKIAAAMVEVAREQGIAKQLCWGGVWDRWVEDFAGADPSEAGMRCAVEAYCKRHPGPDFIDGPHWQLGRLG